jgi:hypothetical protein
VKARLFDARHSPVCDLELDPETGSVIMTDTTRVPEGIVGMRVFNYVSMKLAPERDVASFLEVKHAFAPYAEPLATADTLTASQIRRVSDSVERIPRTSRNAQQTVLADACARALSGHKAPRAMVAEAYNALIKTLA